MNGNENGGENIRKNISIKNDGNHGMGSSRGGIAWYVLSFLLAAGAIPGVAYLERLRGDVSFSRSVLAVPLWIGLGWMYGRMLPAWYGAAACVESRRRRFAIAASAIFGILLVAGYQLQWMGYTAPGFRGKTGLLLRGALVGLAVLPLTDKGMKWLESAETAAEAASSRRMYGRLFLSCFLGIWLCWLPVWLAYYPVIMSYDFHKQSLEALLGPQYFNNHHPLAHTWLIYVFRNLGERLGSYETGFALFSLMQQMITAAVLGYACVMIFRLVKKKRAAVAAALFFGLFPLISVFVMCTTKDVLFGAFFLLFVLLLTEISLFERSGSRRIFDVCALVAAGVLMILFRNNAWYAMIPFAVLYPLFGPKGKWLKILVLFLLVLVLGKGALLGLQYGFHAHKGSEIEKYSLIYQSMARVGNRQRDNLTEEDAKLLDTYVTRECWDDYNPPLADTIKSPVQKINFNEKKSWNDMGSVLRTWVRFGLHYPNEYIDAFLDLTRGYWFLDDTSHAEMLGTDPEERMGLLYTYNSAAEESLPGMQHISKFPWLEEKLERIVTSNVYNEWPVLAIFFRPALWCLLPVAVMAWFWYRRDAERAGILLYPVCYFATMLLGPTAIIRYVYPFLLLAPVLLGLVFRKAQGDQ